MRSEKSPSGRLGLYLRSHASVTFHAGPLRTAAIYGISCAPVPALADLRRGEIFALNHARQPMHRALADFAGLALRLKLLGDLLQKLRP
jgi:hypothetical protein